MPPVTGFRGFVVVWAGQVVSLVGSQMTRFALIYWLFEETEQATPLTLLALASFVPALALAPLAGILADRYDRRMLLVASTLGSAVLSGALLALHLGPGLSLGPLYLLAMLLGAVQAVQFPAFAAAVATLVEERSYGRASGMVSMSQSLATICGPPAAAVLLGVIGLSGVLLLDIGSFLIAAGCLAVIAIPRPATSGPESSQAGDGGRRALLRDLAFGFRYIAANRSFLRLQIVFLAANLLSGFGYILLAPTILARTGENELALGTVQAAFGVGGLAGALLLAMWGGPRSRTVLLVAGIGLSGGAGQVLFGISQEVATWAAAAFLMAFFLPMINGMALAIWQARVPPPVQGRVFAAGRMLAQLSTPLAFLAAGPLADRVFEPAMQPGGVLAEWFGGWIGTGTGAGMSLLILVSGVLAMVVALAGLAMPRVRRAEELWND